jgi:hypothetical protein
MWTTIMSVVGKLKAIVSGPKRDDVTRNGWLGRHDTKENRKSTRNGKKHEGNDESNGGAKCGDNHKNTATL